MSHRSETLTSVSLGPFELFERIGAGGMGVVYRGRHPGTDADVAVKVIGGEPDAKALRRFRREVQAHATLLHPSIVQLLDYDEVDEKAAAESDGMLRAGSPYVGMELADGGTIRDLDIDSWPDVRHLLRCVLEGLAHAHAGGVVHRDLKPDNLLVFRDGDEWEVKLTDFGVAHALSSVGQRGQESLASIIGTPKYMAPEQLRGDWREQGPWTDIYAVGCIAFSLVTGHAAFEGLGLDGVKVALAHMTGPRPEVRPQFAVPTGLRDWIWTAMAVAPEDRFQRANEALAELPASDAPVSMTSRAGEAIGSSDTTETVSVETATAETVVVEQDVGTSDEDVTSLRRDRPVTPPDDWRDVEERISAPAFAGLGLVGIRQPALVGRERERDILWDAYRRTASQRTFEAVVIEGEAGIGKTRLMNWLTRLAHEAGSASVVRLGDLTRTAEGLEEALRTWKISRFRVYEHLLRTLPPLDGSDASRDYDARALTEILRPTSAGSTGESADGPRLEFSSAREKLVVLERLLRRMSSVRPTIVAIDDLHVSGMALDLLEFLVGRGGLPGVFVVGTLRTDLVDAESRLGERISAIAEADPVRTISLGPLTDEESRELARQLASWSRGTEVLVERMEGNPLFGVQLLTDWVERDLVRTVDEATLMEALEDLPEDIHAVWLERVRRLEAQLDDPSRFRRTLELLATVGQTVAESDWEALQRVDDQLAPDVWERLVERGLARRTETGWRFSHGLLVKSLRRIAEDAGRLAEHHRECAEALEIIFERDSFRVARRLADHWIAAGHPEKALSPLLEEAERAKRDDDPYGSREALRRRRSLLDQLDVPADDLMRAGNDLEILRDSLRLGGAPEEIYEEALAVLDRISARTAPDLESKAWRVAAMCREAVGEGEDAHRCISRAVDAARDGGGDRALVMALLRLCRLELWYGRDKKARAVAERAIERAEKMGDTYLVLRSKLAAGWAAVGGGDLEAATLLQKESLEPAREIGFRHLEADSKNGLGTAASMRGDVEEAMEQFAASIRVYEEIGAPSDAALVHMNLAIAEIQAGGYDEASRRIDAAASTLEDYGYSFHHRHMLFAQAAIAAGRADWREFEARMDELESILFGPEARLQSDDAWLADVVRDVVAGAGNEERAARAEALAARVGETNRSEH